MENLYNTFCGSRGSCGKQIICLKSCLLSQGRLSVLTSQMVCSTEPSGKLSFAMVWNRAGTKNLAGDWANHLFITYHSIAGFLQPIRSTEGDHYKWSQLVEQILTRAIQEKHPFQRSALFFALLSMEEEQLS